MLCIDKTRRKLYYVKKSKIIKTMDARFGCASTRTREGVFSVFQKNRDWDLDALRLEDAVLDVLQRRPGRALLVGLRGPRVCRLPRTGA